MAEGEEGERSPPPPDPDNLKADEATTPNLKVIKLVMSLIIGDIERQIVSDFSYIVKYNH